jgi:hypothetical protein
VLFAYVSFWITKAAVPARVGLGIFTAVFELSNQVSLSAKLPILGYHVWLLDFLTISFQFTSSGLIVYAMVNWGMQCEAWCKAADAAAKAKVTASAKPSGDGATPTDLFPAGTEPSTKHKQRLEYRIKRQCAKLQALDAIMRVLFAVLYLTFIGVMFGSVSDYQDEANSHASS